MHQSATDFQRYRYGFGLTGRIMYFLQETDPRIIMLALAVMLILVVLTLMGRRLPLFFTLLASLLLSGSVWSSLDAAAGIARMGIIALLCLQVLKLKSGPGAALTVFASSVLLGLPQSVFSRDLLWSMQWGAVLFGSVLVAWTLGDAMPDRQAVKKVLSVFIIAGCLWTLLGAVSLRELMRAGAGGERFAGLNESAGIFSDTGGICMPFLLWGALRRWNKLVRFGCGSLFVVAAIVLFSCGQRGGLFAGVIACLPQLARLNFQRIAFTAAVLMVIGLLGLFLSSFNQKHTQYLLTRYLSTDLSNRDVIWRQGLSAVMTSPIIGHGYGSNRREMRDYIRNQKTVHNMYLSVWYDIGMVGLLPFVASMCLAAWQGARLSFKAGDREIQDLARLCVGLVGAIMAAGFFGSWASSPTGLSTITLLVCMIALHRLNVIDQAEIAAAAVQRWQLEQARLLAWRRSQRPALAPAAMTAGRRTSRAAAP